MKRLNRNSVRLACIITAIAMHLLLPGVLAPQTPRTLAGMQAYNRGEFATAYHVLQHEAEAGMPKHKA
jgi:hypothetical protein